MGDTRKMFARAQSILKTTLEVGEPAEEMLGANCGTCTRFSNPCYRQIRVETNNGNRLKLAIDASDFFQFLRSWPRFKVSMVVPPGHLFVSWRTPALFDQRGHPIGYSSSRAFLSQLLLNRPVL